MLTALVALAVSLGVAGGCVREVDDSPLSDGEEVGAIPGDEVDDVDEPIEPDTGLDGGDAPSADAVVEAALADVNAYWERSYDDIYDGPFEPISGKFHPYGPDTRMPPCGNPPPTYEEIAGNAFYCPPDDLIAWDRVNLVPELYEEFGGFTLGIVFAHEFGHAVQNRAGVLGIETIVTELQADCFAGAWTADVEAGNSEFFKVTLDDLEKTIAGFLSLRDGVGTSAQDPAAHGTGFDRIGAFSEGYEQGLERCADYPEVFRSGDLVIVEVPFTRADDFQRGGNLPLDELIPLLIADLEDFWSQLLPTLEDQPWRPVEGVVPVEPESDEVTCGDEEYSGDELVGASFYCVPDNTIYIDAVHLVPALDEIGDYAVGTELARQYAYAAQVQMGHDDPSAASDLQADCYAGVYAASGFTGDRGQDLTLSPGDLDEAVISFLHRSDSSPDPEEGTDPDTTVATAFERFDAYRSGFVDGVEPCEALLEE
ncbi:MAG: neutral zinc metallopeptidase [Acidimicrobiales bacterium]